MARLCSKNDKQSERRHNEMMGIRMPAVDACRDHPTNPCEYLEKDSDYCTAYAFPKTRWKLGNCPLATHIETEKSKKGKIRVGQQKQRKIR